MSKTTGVEVRPVESAEAAVRGSHVVNVITKASEPVLKGDWLEPGQHVNAAGSNALTRREIDDAVVKKCDVIVVDGRGTARNECGDLLSAGLTSTPVAFDIFSQKATSLSLLRAKTLTVLIFLTRHTASSWLIPW